MGGNIDISGCFAHLLNLDGSASFSMVGGFIFFGWKPINFVKMAFGIVCRCLTSKVKEERMDLIAIGLVFD